MESRKEGKEMEKRKGEGRADLRSQLSCKEI